MNFMHDLFMWMRSADIRFQAVKSEKCRVGGIYL